MVGMHHTGGVAACTDSGLSGQKVDQFMGADKKALPVSSLDCRSDITLSDTHTLPILQDFIAKHASGTSTAETE